MCIYRTKDRNRVPASDRPSIEEAVDEVARREGNVETLVGSRKESPGPQKPTSDVLRLPARRQATGG
jgi:hypothetical protein